MPKENGRPRRSVNDDNNGVSSSSPSHLLIWPRRPKRRREREPNHGYVLGWNVPPSLSGSSSAPTKEEAKTGITIVAGILSPHQSRTWFEDRLQWIRKQLRKNNKNRKKSVSSSGPDNDDEMRWMMDSLQLVAYYRPHRSKEENKHRGKDTEGRINSSETDSMVDGLPRLCQYPPGGHPWWWTHSTTTSRRHSPPSHVIYYDPFVAPYYDSSFCCQASRTTSSSSTQREQEWSRILKRLKYAAIIMIWMHIPTQPHLEKALMAHHKRAQQLQQQQTKSTLSPTSTPPRQIQAKALVWYSPTSSMLFLHYRRLWYDGNDESCKGWNLSSVLHCLAPVRVMRSLRQLSTTQTKKHPVDVHHLSSQWDRLVRDLIDGIGGLIIAALLIKIVLVDDPTVLRAYVRHRLEFMEAILSRGTTWLEDFPVGFKLNVPLTQRISVILRHLIIDWQQSFLLEYSTLWNLRSLEKIWVPLLAVGFGLGGLSNGLAILIDLWRAEHLYLTIATRSFRLVYQVELYLLSAFFRLFRGKKRNPLRERTDSMEYDAMQLLVGTIAFCICIFLWTTLLIYYTFFMTLNLLVGQLPVLGMLVLYSLCCLLKWGSLFWRLRHPVWFTKDLYLETLMPPSHKNDTQSSLHVSNLSSISESSTSILVDNATSPVKKLSGWCLIALQELLLPRLLLADNETGEDPCGVPLQNIMMSQEFSH